MFVTRSLLKSEFIGNLGLKPENDRNVTNTVDTDFFFFFIFCTTLQHFADSVCIKLKWSFWATISYMGFCTRYSTVQSYSILYSIIMFWLSTLYTVHCFHSLHTIKLRRIRCFFLPSIAISYPKITEGIMWSKMVKNLSK